MTGPVIGLVRHVETERRFAGSSPGTKLLFSALERSLADKCSLRLLPADFYGSSPGRAVQMADALLSGVDALVLSVMPGYQFDLAAFTLLRQRNRRRVPFIFLALGEFPRGGLFYRYLYRYLDADDLIWLSSTADHQIFKRLVAATPADVCVLPFGIDPAAYRRAAQLRLDTRREYGVSEDEVVFVVHGRIEPGKNVHAATALIGQLARHGKRCRLWLVSPSPADSVSPSGPLPLRAMPPGGGYREVLVKSLRGADPGLVWWWEGGSRDRVARIVAAADVSLNLTLNHDENFGFSTVEAMAAGLPVIGTDWGGLKDTIEDGVTGFRIPTTITRAGVAIDHLTALLRATRLADNKSARHRMGAAAVTRVYERYLIEHCTDALLGQVRDLCGGRTTVPRDHQWTPLGQRMEQLYSVPINVPPGVAPAPMSLRTPEGKEIGRELLRPYGTRDQDLNPDPSSVFVLAPAVVGADSPGVTSVDPIYPLTFHPGSPVEAEVCSLFAERTYLTCTDLVRSTGVDAQQIVAALRRLLEAGAIVQSRDKAGTQAGPGPARP